MDLNYQIAKHLREVHFGGNWTSVNLKDVLSDLEWEQSVTQVDSLNTIAALVYHINYYVRAILKVLEAGPLDSKDIYSFDLPPIRSKEDWEKLKEQSWTDTEKLAKLIEELPDRKLGESFSDEKYGSYYRNLHGLVEHTHYHLGQIMLIKKLILTGNRSI